MYGPLNTQLPVGLELWATDKSDTVWKPDTKRRNPFILYPVHRFYRWLLQETSQLFGIKSSEKDQIKFSTIVNN